MPLHFFDKVENEAYDLSALGITTPVTYRNLSTPILYEEALRYEKGSFISDSGALIVSSNKYKGRVPKEKRIVQDDLTKDAIAWGDINIPIDTHTFLLNKARAVDYLDSRSRIYIVDGYAGRDKKYRIKVRTICSRAYHAIFMKNMLIRPTDDELKNFGEPEYLIINAGAFPANRRTEGTTSDASVQINFTTKEMIILGTEYAGEMKKGIFTVMNFLMPQQKILSMHCAVNQEKNKNISLFFGLSGTGKTTLSTSTHAQLVGDDEHCWSDEGIFNIEGGCYAKCVDPPLNIRKCISFGTLLENVAYDRYDRKIDFSDESLTSNTRASYPIHHVKNALIAGKTQHPSHIIFLTCDAFGIFPPIAKLNKEQAMYHFVSGYTSKTPNTEVDITQPTATFSACFGEAFLPLPPSVYAELFAERIHTHNTQVWLVNTGWIGGDFHSGTRIPLRETRTIVQKICTNSIKKSAFIKDPLFGFDTCVLCEGVSIELNPRKAWKNKDEYELQARVLVAMFHQNIQKYEHTSFISGGPLKKQY